ncbi:Regulatory protein AsnC [subsurface metagenome]
MYDDLDRRLIEELQKNGRESYTNLAKTLGVVEGTVRKRLKGLLDRGIIKIAAIPNLLRLGYNLMIIMALDVRIGDIRKVGNHLAEKPNVLYLTSATGRYDIIVMIAARSTQELNEFIEDEIASMPSVLKTETFVTLDIIKAGAGFLDTAQIMHNHGGSLLRRTKNR